ncbi:MAG: ABC transporter ATP-binding protein [Clostridia bacterium]|nr:ABC transporter ATP-binding protein [Clostridia bacterium]
MLPLDKLPHEHDALLAANNINQEQIAIVLRLDLDAEGNFGESYLMLGEGARTLWCVDPVAQAIKTYDTATLTEPYIDNFTTSNRILGHLYPPGYEPLPRKADFGDDENAYKAALTKYHAGGETIILGYCTNACKRRLLTFVNIWERLYDGQTVTENDPIFEQFNAKYPKCGTVYPDQQRRICEHCTKKAGTLTRMLSYFKDFKLQLAVVILCLFATAGISLLNPIISGQILFDRVISEPSYEVTLTDGTTAIYTAEEMQAAGYATEDAVRQITGQLHELKYVYIIVGVLIALAILSLAISILQNRCNAYMSTRVTRNMKVAVFRAIQRLSLSFFNKNSTGGLINRVNYDAVRIRSFYIDGVPQLIINVVKFIGVAIFLFIMNWKLTLIVFIPVPIIVCMFKFMLPKLWRSYNRQWRRSHSLNVMLGDSLGGVRVVKAFAKEAEETNRFYMYSTKLYEANLKTNLISLSIFPVISLLIGMSSQAIWGFGGLEVMGDSMTYGELTAYLGYIGMIFAPLNFFTSFTNIMTDTMNSAVRMFETLDQIPEIADAPDAVEIKEFQGHIKFDQVCFHYNPNRPIVKSVSFEIQPGDHVGIVGHTGSGKSTVANLITRMYDVISGSVEIDGHNVKEIKTDSLRKGIAIVSQEIFLFRGTIADNIRYARPDASMEDVIAAARAANAHDFIMKLPEGYETMVGIGSRSLSGGERQRISIARALLLSPSILILDEATAAMDTETERQISEAIEKLIVGRTTISIAHRLSTLKDCNYLMAIENGEVVEIGTAEELMEKKGCYYKLYTLQNEQMKKVMQGL